MRKVKFENYDSWKFGEVYLVTEYGWEDGIKVVKRTKSIGFGEVKVVEGLINDGFETVRITSLSTRITKQPWVELNILSKEEIVDIAVNKGIK